MKRAHNQFLDLEAGGSGNDSESDEGEDDGFIQDANIESDTPQRRFAVMDDNSNREGNWVDMTIASLVERYGPKPHEVIGGNTSELEQPLASHSDALASAIDRITRWPTIDDYPLWRVRCKPGLEEEVVFSLLQLVAPKHELRSAFVNKCGVGGWVYLETTMNKQLAKLLTITPGVFHNDGGLVYQWIERSEGLELLTMSDSKPLGQWVKVRRGIYKGDVGHVMSTRDSSVQLLLVPRLPPPKSIGVHTHTTAPALFDHETVKQVYGTEPVRVNENIYSFQGNTFEHGLVIKELSLDSVSKSVSSMPLHLFCLFGESLHPKIVACESMFPKPSEWFFAEGDEAFIWKECYPPSYKSGTISALRTDSIDLTTMEGIVKVPWSVVRKVVREGDYVEITGDTYQGQTGWVVGFPKYVTNRDNMATIALQVEDKATLLRTEIVLHVNLLKRVAIPHALGTHPHPPNVMPRSERIPWIDTAVIITGHHPLRTYPGIVKDVLPGQRTFSGLRIVIQLTRLDSNSPFKCLTLDYDNVVEASRGIKLYDYARSTSEIFTPKNWGPPKLPPVLIRQPFFESLDSCNPIPGFATPMPETPLSSSPAWNPSSDIPDTTDSHVLGSPDHLPDPGFRHPLLDSRLLNVQLGVIVTGGKFNAKTLTATVQSIDGRLSLHHTVYKTPTALPEEWVTPKYPNPTRDNGLLIVIKGEHCGKYVRRIHHRYEDTTAIVILAVVDRVAGHMDKFTGEKLELDVSYLCVCKESFADKELNSSLMDELREEARKTRAK